MMVTFTPPVKPAPGSTSKTTTPRVRTARFGDGYSQRALDGLNYLGRVVVLDWPILSAADADTIEAFMNARGGSEAFYYTLPLETTAYKWTNGAVKRSYQGGSMVGINVTLTQEFDL